MLVNAKTRQYQFNLTLRYKPAHIQSCLTQSWSERHQLICACVTGWIINCQEYSWTPVISIVRDLNLKCERYITCPDHHSFTQSTSDHVLTDPLSWWHITWDQWSYYRMAKIKSPESLECNTSVTNKASKGQWWKFKLHDTSTTSKAKWWNF